MLGLSLTAISGSLFFDVGNAFCNDDERAGRLHGCAAPDADPLMSAGAELAIDFGAFHNSRVFLRAGIAKPLQGPGDLAPAAYISFGPAF
jgi:hypothetical protein